MTLEEKLKALGLRALGEHLNDVVALATKKRWSVVQIIEHLCTLETDDRATKSQQRRLANSRVGRFKPIVDYDWNWPTQIDRPAIEAALRLDFLDGARNVILVAPNGLGKTMIAQNIAHQAIAAGHSVLFVTAAQMLLDLGAQDSARALERRLKHYARPRLLCIDEIGYLSYDNRNADLLYEVISRRYENKSVVLTTNLAFSDWPTIFPNASSATALIDRVIHHADVTAIEGKSYRKREAEAARSRRATPKA
jgi:DNA replication protein DnaC